MVEHWWTHEQERKKGKAESMGAEDNTRSSDLIRVESTTGGSLKLIICLLISKYF